MTSAPVFKRFIDALWKAFSQSVKYHLSDLTRWVRIVHHTGQDSDQNPNGPVAQLGARINRTDEVAGSNPARSTKFIHQSKADSSSGLLNATQRAKFVFRFIGGNQ